MTHLLLGFLSLTFQLLFGLFSRDSFQGKTFEQVFKPLKKAQVEEQIKLVECLSQWDPFSAPTPELVSDSQL